MPAYSAEERVGGRDLEELYLVRPLRAGLRAADHDAPPPLVAHNAPLDEHLHNHRTKTDAALHHFARHNKPSDTPHEHQVAKALLERGDQPRSRGHRLPCPGSLEDEQLPPELARAPVQRQAPALGRRGGPQGVGRGRPARAARGNHHQRAPRVRDCTAVCRVQRQPRHGLELRGRDGGPRDLSGGRQRKRHQGIAGCHGRAALRGQRVVVALIVEHPARRRLRALQQERARLDARAHAEGRLPMVLPTLTLAGGRVAHLAAWKGTLWQELWAQVR
mmetsp:Transcript_87180/g.241755  ORF Transcript_87180/g.241755 Transcript_87180/m.241755 type:complete len:276 (+) Transcript_87180:532-1359(+)